MGAGARRLAAKSAAYQSASECNGTRRQCVEYGNEENFQGVIFKPVSGTFSYQVEETKRFLLFFKRKKYRTVSAPWSSVSDATEDVVIPEVCGAVQPEAVSVMHADTGVSLRFLSLLADGEVEGVYEVKCRDKKYSPVISGYAHALGRYGSQGQPDSAQFAGAGKFSGTAWVEGALLGSDAGDANDSAPTITAVVKGRVMDVPNPAENYAFPPRQWSDVGPLLARRYLINKGRMRPGLMDDESVIEAAVRCNEPVIDDTGFEQVFLPQQVTGAGMDFRMFASMSGFGAKTVDRIALMLAQGKMPTGGYGQLVQAYYQYINQTQPPAFVAPTRAVRRRYTTNFALKEQAKLGDFLWEVVLPSFNGYLIHRADGRVQIKVDGPADSTLLRDDAPAGATELHVEDITRWQRSQDGLLLVGAHQPTAEVARVVGVRHSSVGDTITLASSATGGIAVGVSGPTLAGAPGAGGGTTGGDVLAHFTPDSTLVERRTEQYVVVRQRGYFREGGDAVSDNATAARLRPADDEVGVPPLLDLSTANGGIAVDGPAGRLTLHIAAAQTATLRFARAHALRLRRTGEEEARPSLRQLLRRPQDGVGRDGDLQHVVPGRAGRVARAGARRRRRAEDLRRAGQGGPVALEVQGPRHRA